MKSSDEEYDWNGKYGNEIYFRIENNESYHPKQYLSLPTFLLVGRPRLEYWEWAKLDKKSIINARTCSRKPDFSVK